MKISPRRSDSKNALRFNWIGLSLLTFGMLTGCTTPASKQPDAATPTANETPAITPATTTVANTDSSPKVVVTNTVLCDLTKQIAASTVNVVCLLAPGSDLKS